VLGEQLWGSVHVLEQAQVRWYNPALEDFEWRKVPQSDEEALSLLDGSWHTSRCTETYKEWRELGASTTAALIRAGEAATVEARRRVRMNEEDERASRR
jgi:hypothetical protein